MNAPRRPGVTEQLREGSAEMLGWLKLAGMEKTSPPRDLAALQQAAQSTNAPPRVGRRGGAQPVAGCCLGPLLEQLAQTLEAMAQVLCSGGYPVEIVLDAHIWR